MVVDGTDDTSGEFALEILVGIDVRWPPLKVALRDVPTDSSLKCIPRKGVRDSRISLEAGLKIRTGHEFLSKSVNMNGKWLRIAVVQLSLDARQRDIEIREERGTVQHVAELECVDG